MPSDRRQDSRVKFEYLHRARIIAIDGTWFRECQLLNVSETGARLRVEGAIDNIHLDEFFLVLSTVGKAHRRCKRVRQMGDEIGVHFIKGSHNKDHLVAPTLDE